MCSLALVDILQGTKIKSPTFIDPILDLSRQKLHMLVWMRDIKIFIDTTLNSPGCKFPNLHCFFRLPEIRGGSKGVVGVEIRVEIVEIRGVEIVEIRGGWCLWGLPMGFKVV